MGWVTTKFVPSNADTGNEYPSGSFVEIAMPFGSRTQPSGLTRAPRTGPAMDAQGKGKMAETATATADLLPWCVLGG